MLRCLTIFIQFFLFIILISTRICSQNYLDGPESVAFDSLNERYLVSSLRNNKIVSIDKNGNQVVFKDNIIAFGNCIKDSVLYVTGNSTIRGLNVLTTEVVFSVTIPGVLQFDGITSDDSGYLYALATRIGKVYKVDIASKNYWTFVDSGFGTAPQDLIYDKFQNRLIVCQWHDDSDLLAIDLGDSSLSVVSANTAGRSDGVTIDQFGNIYFTSYSRGGEIYKCDNNFSNPPELIYQGIPEPAGLDYNIIDNVLAVPSFSDDRVEFIKMPPIYLFPKISSDLTTGHAPLEVSFFEESSSNPKINKWEWDFNLDGIIDSENPNPTWTYSNPGVYKYAVSLYSDSLSDTYIYEDSILVFDGESSLSFSQSSSQVIIQSNDQLHLQDTWTFESWIFPTSLHGKYIFDKNNIQLYTNRRSSGLNTHSLVLKLQREDGSTIRISTEDSSLVVAKWQHIAIAYSFSQKRIDFYINGIAQELSLEHSTIFESPIAENVADSLIIGNNYSGLRSFDGRIDEIRLWRIYKSKVELEQTLYDYLEGDESGLLSYWKMNEGNGEILYDQSLNSFVGTIINCNYYWGIDYSTLVGYVKKEENTILPQGFKLYQNYPNPFNPTTKVRFYISTQDRIYLSIYNSLGQEVATLIDKVMDSGSHEFIWNAANFSSGVYIVKLKTTNGILSRKIMLLK